MLIGLLLIIIFAVVLWNIAAVWALSKWPGLRKPQSHGEGRNSRRTVENALALPSLSRPNRPAGHSAGVTEVQQ